MANFVMDNEHEAAKIDLDIMRLFVEAGKLEDFDYRDLLIALGCSPPTPNLQASLALAYLCNQESFEFHLDHLILAADNLSLPDSPGMSWVLSLLRIFLGCGDELRRPGMSEHTTVLWLLCLTVRIATISTFEDEVDQKEQFNAAVICFCLLFRYTYPLISNFFVCRVIEKTKNVFYRKIRLNPEFTFTAFTLAVKLSELDSWDQTSDEDINDDEDTSDDEDMNDSEDIRKYLHTSNDKDVSDDEDINKDEYTSSDEDVSHAQSTLINPLDENIKYRPDLPNVPGAWIEESEEQSPIVREFVSTPDDFISSVYGHFWEPDEYLHIQGRAVVKPNGDRWNILERGGPNFDHGRKSTKKCKEFQKRSRATKAKGQVSIVGIKTLSSLRERFLEIFYMRYTVDMELNKERKKKATQLEQGAGASL